MTKIMLGFFLSGLLFGSGPCIPSCGSILISYIAGTKKNILKGLIVYSLFSLARIFAYLLLGVAVFFFGRWTLERLLGSFSKWVFILGGGFIALIGLLMVLGGSLKFFAKFRAWLNSSEFLRRLQKNILEHDKKSIVIFGLVIGLIPCAPLLSLLTYIGLASKTWTQSLLYSFSFGLGTFVSPLILFVILAGIIPQFLIDKGAVYARAFSSICGLIIMFLGMQLISRAW